MSSITVNGKAYAGRYGSTDQSERIRLGETVFHNGPLGLAAKTTAGMDMGFNREPGGTLNSMTTGGKTYYYLTDAIGRFTQPDPSGQEQNPYLYTEDDPVNRIDPNGLLSLGGTGDGLGIATILYEGFTGGTGAAEKATAAMIADIGITGLCEAGAAAFTGPGAVPALPYCMAIGATAATYIGATYKS